MSERCCGIVIATIFVKLSTIVAVEIYSHSINDIYLIFNPHMDFAPLSQSAILKDLVGKLQEQKHNVLVSQPLIDFILGSITKGSPAYRLSFSAFLSSRQLYISDFSASGEISSGNSPGETKKNLINEIHHRTTFAANFTLCHPRLPLGDEECSSIQFLFSYIFCFLTVGPTDFLA